MLRDHVNHPASPFQPYNWKILQSTSVLSGNSQCLNRKRCTKTPKHNKRKPFCCRTQAEIHTCRSQTINGSPVVASSVVWIRRFNFKYKLLLCCMEAGVQSNFLMVHSPLEFLTLNQPYRTYVKLSKFENLPHNNKK